MNEDKVIYTMHADQYRGMRSDRKLTKSEVEKQFSRHLHDMYSCVLIENKTRRRINMLAMFPLKCMFAPIFTHPEFYGNSGARQTFTEIKWAYLWNSFKEVW